jgi:hypothetical protein
MRTWVLILAISVTWGIAMITTVDLGGGDGCDNCTDVTKPSSPDTREHSPPHLLGVSGVALQLFAQDAVFLGSTSQDRQDQEQADQRSQPGAQRHAAASK